MLQASTPWRKAQAKLEGEPEFEDLSKTDRLEVYQEYMKWALHYIQLCERAVPVWHICFVNDTAGLPALLCAEVHGWGNGRVNLLPLLLLCHATVRYKAMQTLVSQMIKWHT